MSPSDQVPTNMHKTAADSRSTGRSSLERAKQWADLISTLTRTITDNRETFEDVARATFRAIRKLPEAVRDTYRQLRLQLKRIALLTRGADIQVLGAKSAGKTTLLRRLMGDPELAPPEPTGGPTDLLRGPYIVEDSAWPVRFVTQDIGGEPQWQEFWPELLMGREPSLVIFVVDHLHVERHRTALSLLIRIINEHREHLKKLKVVLFLVNKSDLWGGEETEQNYLRILEQYVDLLQGLRGIRLVTAYCCAKRTPIDPELVHALEKVIEKL